MDLQAKKEDKLRRIELALDSLSGFETDCRVCPRECRVNRHSGEKGFCQSTNKASLSHALLHYGEEPAISGLHDWSLNRTKNKGSGTIFFSGCNLKCLFCQNYQLSWLNKGKIVTDEELAGMMLNLEKKGALNINLVSPTHQILAILRALRIAYGQGFNLPLVYNSNGYEKVGVLRNLNGIIDIYLPDLKYFDSRVAGKFSGASDYFSQASLAIQEMYLQQPELILDEEEIARQGLIIRHLVLPGQTEDSLTLLEWIKQNLSPSICLSLMSQYYPCFKAPEEIRRPLTRDEYELVIKKAEDLGFESLFIQPISFGPDDHLVPDFNLPDPFRWEKPKGV